MPIEVELKAHVEDHEATRRRLENIASRTASFDKRDVYFCRTGEEHTLFRLRREGDRNCVTYKEKQRSSGIEVNHEHEFEVADDLEFIQFCRYLGYTNCIEKHKTGEHFLYKEANVELTLVERLGWFVEIERLVDKEDKVEAARITILSILADLGITEERIEARYYNEMLRELRSEE